MNGDSTQAQIEALQKEIALLRQVVDQTRRALEQSDRKLDETTRALEQARRENTIIRQKLDAFVRRYFGKKSERLDSAQLELLLSGLGQTTVQSEEPKTELAPQPARRRSNPGSQRVRTPDNLEVVREVIEPEQVKARPEQWKRIGQEVSRHLDYQPGKFFWLETVRPKYVPANDRLVAPVIAPAPERVVERGLAAPGLLAHLFVSKYCDHLPFYRQEQIFRQRHDVFISRQQMVQWTEQSVRLLSAIEKVIKEQMRKSPYVQVDETPVRYQDPDRPGRCGQGYLWTALVPGQCVVYEWHASRAARCLDSLLGKEYRGNVQCDAYSAYTAFSKDKEYINLFGCWAHVRREFFEAKEQNPKLVGWILSQIGMLYGCEQTLRKNRAGPKLREALRSSHSRMVVNRLKRLFTKLREKCLPQSLLGKAVNYALNQWPALERFLEYGRAEIDNNLVENAIRPTALGKKNWLFFGSEEAGERSAVIYTLIGNCRMHGIEPYAYLKDVLERLLITD